MKSAGGSKRLCGEEGTRRRLALCLVLAAVPLGAARAETVAPSRVTPPSLRPEPSTAASVTIPESEGLAAPAHAAELKIRIGRVAVEGDFEERRAETEALVAGLAGRTVTIADIYAAAQAIQKAYADAGFPLVRVAVPAQRLEPGGFVRIVVVDGVIEAVDLAGVPERQRAFVEAHLDPLIGRPHLSLGEIERRLLVPADAPGLSLRSTLMAGKAPGTSRLVIEATQKTLSGSLGFNNGLSDAMKLYTVQTSLAVSGALGLGEQAYVSLAGSPQSGLIGTRGPMRLWGGGFVLPIGADGLTLNPEITHSVTRPTPAVGTPATQGTFDRLDVHLAYPLVRSRAETMIARSTFEWTRQRLVPIGFDTDLYKDNYRVLRLGLSERRQFDNGLVFSASGTLSQGLGGRLGDTTLHGIPLSRAGAGPDFHKIGGDVRVDLPAPGGTLVSLALRGQTSFGTPLLVGEQFGLDGPDNASAFPAGTFSVDEGLGMRAEWSWPTALSVMPATAAPYLFGAGGRGWIDRPQRGEEPRVDAASFGVGLRLAGSDAAALPGSSIGLELARGFTTAPNQRNRYRGNLTMSVPF